MKETAVFFAVCAVFFTAGFNAFSLDGGRLQSDEHTYAAGIEGRFSLGSLQMLETVYADSPGTGTAGKKLISEIDWGMGLQMAAGIALHIEPADLFNKIGFSLAGAIQWYFPMNNRTMKDSDWDDGGNLFNYGESPASMLSGMEAEVQIGLLFPVRKEYLIRAGMEVWYARYAVSAHDGWNSSTGSGFGGGLGDSDEKTPLYGTAVEYSQEWAAIAPAVEFRRKLKNGSIGIGAAVSPFVWGQHIDNHFFRKLDDSDGGQKYVSYSDSTRGGIYYKIQGNWLIDITKNASLDIAVHYRAVENSRGDTTVRTAGLAGYSFLDEGGAGASVRTFSINAAIRARL